jgi:hypothetical protein
MSHLIERYALSSGSKIDHPYIYETYFPIPFAKYITFQAQSKFESKDYHYFQDVIDFIAPILEKEGIHILQLGTANEKPYKKVVDLRGQTTFNQLAYVMKSSLLHFGPDSLGVHLASTYNVPIIGLYSIIQSSVAGPYFGDKSKQILLEAFKRVGNGKPSYSPVENPKSINLIKPEEIANGILKLLNIDFQVPFNTVFTGKRYSQTIMRELIPNTTNMVSNVEEPIEVRTDLFYDESILAHHLSYLKKAVVVTNKRIPIKLLKHFKTHIALVVYKITENDEPEFVKDLAYAGLPTLLLSSLTGEVLNKKKLSYYEYGNITPIEFPNSKDVEELKKDIGSLYYRSIKLIADGDKIYGSHASKQNKFHITVDGEYQPVIDSPDFWQDLEFFSILKFKNEQIS